MSSASRSSAFRAVSFVAAGLLASVSEAAIASFTSVLPTSDVLLNNTALSSSATIQVRNVSSSNDRWVGVGFTAPSTSVLSQATFYIGFDANNAGLVGNPALGATMKIDVVSLSSLTGTPATPYSVLYSETATLPATYGNQAYITFGFSNTVNLVSGQSYGIILSFTDTASNRGINLRQSPGGTAGTGGVGNMFYTTDAGEGYITGAPLAFVLQSPSQIPEPSSFAVLAGAGSVALVVALRRRRHGAGA